MNSQIISPTLEKLKGYFKLTAFDCREDEIKKSERFKQMCEKDEYIPFFQLIKPAEVKINPYTKQPMMPTSIPYNDNQVTVPKIKDYILNNLPDFSRHLDKVEKLQDFRDLSQDADINRVILFTKKGKSPALLKVLSAIFRDRFRFGLINVDSSPELVQ